jgi:hypothetical protein
MVEIKWTEHLVEEMYNGQKVKFKCKYWAKDINVELLEPHHDYDGLHIMYLIPRKYDESNWRGTAFCLVDRMLQQKKWEEENADAIRVRQKEANRRQEIISNHLKVLRDALHETRIRIRKAGESYSMKEKQQMIMAIKRNIKELDMMYLGEMPSHWKYKSRAKSYSLSPSELSPSVLCRSMSPRDESKIRIMIHVRPKEFHWGDIESWYIKAWREVYEIVINRVDRGQVGIGEEIQCDFSHYSTVNNIDLEKFKAYLNGIHPFDKHVIEVWQEITGEGAQWVAVVSV